MINGAKFKAFFGTIFVTDLTSGFSVSIPYMISGQKGKVKVAKLKGHIYRATLSGSVTSTTGVGTSIPSGSYLKWVSK